MLFPEQKYFYNCPYQLGYVLVCQIVNYFFKENDYYLVLQIVNLIALIMIYLAIIFMTKYIFKEKQIVNTTILLLFMCLQGIMFTTFIYGNLLGFALAMWAVVFEIKYIQSKKKYFIPISAILIGLSITIKSNNMIVLVAMCIIFFINFLDKKDIEYNFNCCLCSYWNKYS